MKWYKRDPAAALEGMTELTLEEIGAYTIVIDILYARDGNLPDDDRFLAKACRVRPQVWRRLKASLIAKGKLHQNSDETGTKLMANRVETELISASKLIENMTHLGEVSAAKAKEKKDLASTGRSNGARDTTTTTTTTRKEEAASPLAPEGATVLAFPNGNGSMPLTPSPDSLSSSPPQVARRPSSPPPGFDAFWAAYPRKVSKGAAVKAYGRVLAKTSPEALVAAVKAQAPGWATIEAKFIKHAATWLNQECWLDEVIKPKRPAWGAVMP